MDVNVIEIAHMTKDYGQGRGIFDLTFSVKKGEVMGFLGPNGAGKTTAIRQLMGFCRPDQGICRINGMDCKRNADQIQEGVGYLPGEIAFMEDMTGIEFLEFVADMKRMKDDSRMRELTERLELDPRGKIKKMSKGMKQKIGIVCAFMTNPEILILDEPTSGLDPLMQNIFVELILEEKKKGTTVLMSSHMFEEVEKTCDRTAIIKEGKLMILEKISALQKSKSKIYRVDFLTKEMAEAFSKETGGQTCGQQVTVTVKGNPMPFLRAMVQYQVVSLSTEDQSLEELFMYYYGGGKKYD